MQFSILISLPVRASSPTFRKVKRQETSLHRHYVISYNKLMHINTILIFQVKIKFVVSVRC